MIEEEKSAADTGSNDDGVDAGDDDVPATNNKYNRISKDYRQLLIIHRIAMQCAALILKIPYKYFTYLIITL